MLVGITVMHHRCITCSSQSRSETLNIKAIGIVDDIATKTGTGLGTGIGVKWKKDFTPISVVLNDETFRNNVYNNTLYEEFDLDIINRIINALI